LVRDDIGGLDVLFKNAGIGYVGASDEVIKQE